MKYLYLDFTLGFFSGTSLILLFGHYGLGDFANVEPIVAWVSLAGCFSGFIARCFEGRT
jgi:hypothetical protein